MAFAAEPAESVALAQRATPEAVVAAMAATAGMAASAATAAAAVAVRLSVFS